MKRLIINADDFGLTDGVSAGIVESILHGVVTSTTAMVAVPDADTHLTRWASAIPNRIGLHLQLTGGWPCQAAEDVPSLLNGGGQFPRSRKQLGTIEPGEASLEWQAQLARLREWGIAPTHLDSHHHVHHLRPVIPAFTALAAMSGLPARTGPLPVAHALRTAHIPHPDYLDTSWYGDDLTADRLIQAVSQAFDRIGGQGVVELMCHPGYADDTLAAVSNYVEGREQELALLRSDELAERLETLDVHLISYAELGLHPT
ncbi:MAG: ChbG/HpnK family deacetylase [Candidatus Methylumidiphilus sp.]